MRCRLLEVSRSGYFASLGRIRPTAREKANADMVDEIRQIHEDSRGTYGRPRILKELHRRGHEIGKGRVGRLMGASGIRGRVRRKHRVTTDSEYARPVAENVLDRECAVESPDTVWCADITYIATASGWVYLAAIIDLSTRMIVGWSMATLCGRSSSRARCSTR